MTDFEKMYRSVHERWTGYANGDFDVDPESHCAFCRFAIKYSTSLRDKCRCCPAYHASGQCMYNPVLDEFYTKFHDDAETAEAAAEVLALLERIKPELEMNFNQIPKGELP